MTHNQTSDILKDAGWRELIGRLPATVDVAVLARERRAFVRARGVPDAEALLRLALTYGATSLSLRGTAAWSSASGLADISDVALLGRLQAAGDWLGDLVGALLSAALHTQAGGAAGGLIDGRRLRLVDATTVASPGAAGLWRLHADYDLSKGRFVDLSLTDHHTAESLEHFAPAAGDVVVADSYHAKASQLHHVAAAGGDFIVRRGLTGCTVLDMEGRKLDSKRVLAAPRDGGTLDIPVLVPPPPGAKAEPIRARLVVQPLPEDRVAGAQRRARKRAKKEGRTITQKRLQAAQLCMLLTSLDRESADADTVLRLYRLRWQIEIAFKRLKSLARLADVQAKDPRLVRSCLFAKLIVALLAEEVTQNLLESFPSG
jgi:hypothetical protein